MTVNKIDNLSSLKHNPQAGESGAGVYSFTFLVEGVYKNLDLEAVVERTGAFDPGGPVGFQVSFLKAGKQRKEENFSVSYVYEHKVDVHKVDVEVPALGLKTTIISQEAPDGVRFVA